MLAFLPLGGCVFNALESIQALQSADVVGSEPDVEIEYSIRAAKGDDVITVYADESRDVLLDIVPALGIQSPRYGTEQYGFTSIRDAGRERLITRSDDRWNMTIEAGIIQQLLAAGGVERFRITLCHPSVEVRVLRAPRNSAEAICDAPFGLAWDIEQSETAGPLTLELMPSDVPWNAYVIGVIVWFALFSLIAFATGRVMRRDLPRTGGAMVLIVLIVGLLGSVVAAGATLGIWLVAGPADNLALSRDLDLGGMATAILGPAAGAFVPWVTLVLTVAWGMRWRHRRRDVEPPSVPFSA